MIIPKITRELPILTITITITIIFTIIVIVSVLIFHGKIPEQCLHSNFYTGHKIVELERRIEQLEGK